ncbi:MAG: hypothetical protein VX642_09560 [Bdellovibrionota bacterium]|nr:hypothetical protein [Bdellovibrionota bacterium]
MGKLSLKSSLLKFCMLSLFTSACDRLPADFGLRVADPESGASIICDENTSNFGIIIPSVVEQGDQIVLRFKGGGEAKWTLNTTEGERHYQGLDVSVSFDDVQVVSGNMTGTSVCLSEESHEFSIDVIEKLGEAHLNIAEDKAFTNLAKVDLLHSVSGAEEMIITASPNCVGEWQRYRQDSIVNLYNGNSENRFFAKFRNQLRETNCVSTSIIHDSEAPSLRLVNLPPVISNKVNFSVGIEASDTLSGVAQVFCKIDSSDFQVCGNSFIQNNLSEGLHSLEFYAIDNVGNTSNVMDYEFSIDTTAPVIAWEQFPNAYVAPGVVNFVAKEQVKENLVWTCSYDAQVIQNCTGSFSKQESAEGLHNVMIYATDSNGNKSNILSRGFAVDASGPVIQITDKPLNPSVDKKAEFSFVANDQYSQVTGYYCSLNNAQYSECKSPMAYQLDNAFHSFKVYAVDSLGNVGQAVNYEWEIDDGIVSEEILVSKPVKKVDIVVVIDNSSSMDKEQKEIGKRFGNFIDSLAGLDWRLGIITTNADNDGPHSGGRLQNFANNMNRDPIYYLDSSVRGYDEYFKRTIRRRESGNDTEEGIKSIRKFLNREDSQILRDHSNFATIIISDEDERSRGTNLRDENKPEKLIKAISDKYEGKKVYSNHSVVYRPGDDRCARRGGKYEANVYAELTQLTDGILADICSDDYSSQLADIGDRIQETAFSLALQCEPRDTDGDAKPNLVVNLSPSQDVQYEVKKNKVFFTPYPEEGTKMHLVYRCKR